MKFTVRIILALFILISLGTGLVPARSVDERAGEGKALSLLNGLSSDSLSAFLNHDGVAVYGPKRRKRRKRTRRRRRAEVIQIIPPSKAIPMIAPAPPPPPPEPMEAPVQMEAPTEAAPPVRSSPASGPEGGARPKSAPRIKPPSVQIKPPTR